MTLKLNDHCAINIYIDNKRFILLAEGEEGIGKRSDDPLGFLPAAGRQRPARAQSLPAKFQLEGGHELSAQNPWGEGRKRVKSPPLTGRLRTEIACCRKGRISSERQH